MNSHRIVTLRKLYLSPIDILNITPVHLVTDWDRVRLFEVEPSSISIKRQLELLDKISNIFTERKMKLTLISDLKWRLELFANSEVRSLKSAPLNRVVGENLYDFMPSGKDALFWKQLFNEVQMELHSANLLTDNVTDSGRISIAMPQPAGVINGVWVWKEPSIVEKMVFGLSQKVREWKKR